MRIQKLCSSIVERTKSKKLIVDFVLFFKMQKTDEFTWLCLILLFDYLRSYDKNKAVSRCSGIWNQWSLYGCACFIVIRSKTYFLGKFSCEEKFSWKSTIGFLRKSEFSMLHIWSLKNVLIYAPNSWVNFFWKKLDFFEGRTCVFCLF